MLDGSQIDPILTGQSDSSHVGFWLIQLLADKLYGFDGALTSQMRGIAYLYFIVVYPHVDEIGRLAAKDHLVITGVLQFWSEEPPHHRIGHQPGLRRDS